MLERLSSNQYVALESHLSPVGSGGCCGLQDRSCYYGCCAFYWKIKWKQSTRKVPVSGSRGQSTSVYMLTGKFQEEDKHSRHMQLKGRAEFLVVFPPHCFKSWGSHKRTLKCDGTLNQTTWSFHFILARYLKGKQTSKELDNTHLDNILIKVME